MTNPRQKKQATSKPSSKSSSAGKSGEQTQPGQPGQQASAPTTLAVPGWGVGFSGEIQLITPAPGSIDPSLSVTVHICARTNQIRTGEFSEPSTVAGIALGLEWRSPGGDPTEQRGLPGDAPSTSQMVADLVAGASALRAAALGHPQSGKLPGMVVLRPSSNYLAEGLSEWLPMWELSNWRTAQDKPIKNRTLWEAINDQVKALEAAGCKVSWSKVKKGSEEGAVGAEQLAKQMSGLSARLHVAQDQAQMQARQGKAQGSWTGASE